MATGTRVGSVTDGGRRKSAPRADKRRAILDAAAPVFGDGGYERASIDAIAAAAGVSKPTVYSYFGDKQNLFRESVADSAEQQNAAAMDVIIRADLTGGDWQKTLRTLGLQMVACRRTPCAVFLGQMIASESRRDPEVYRTVWDKAGRPVLDALAGRMAMLGNAGHLQIPDPALAARQFLALVAAQVPELTENGSRDVSDADIRKAVDAGVQTFVRAHTPIQ